MKLLFVSSLRPWPTHTGAAQRVYHILEGFTRSHRVTLVNLVQRTAAPVDETFPLRERCERVIEVSSATCAVNRTRRYHEWPSVHDRVISLISSPQPSLIRRWKSPELLQALRILRASDDFDAVWVVRSYIAEMVRAAGFQRLVVDVDDIESAAMARMLKVSGPSRSKPLQWAEWLKLDRYERRLPGRFSRLVVCKAEDRGFFGADAEPRVFVVPNGTAAFPPTAPELEVPGEVLFVGVLNYAPNIDAVRYFRADILPLLRHSSPATRFQIVGLRPDPDVLALDNGADCVVTGSVPDVTPYYARASVVAVPLRLGAGTKLKVLEALARGKAVVSTSVGIEGIDVRPGVDLEVADTPAEFAQACHRLLHDPAARRRLGESGRALVLERYGWNWAVEQAEAAVASMRES